MTPNYVDSSPTGIVVSPWCSCRGSGNMEEECEKFLRDFTENPCLRESGVSPLPTHSLLPTCPLPRGPGACLGHSHLLPVGWPVTHMGLLYQGCPQGPWVLSA